MARDTTPPLAEEPDLPPQPTGVAVLGGGTHSVDAVELTEIGTRANGLDVPRDLAFHPAIEGELWVVNRGDESIVVFQNVGTERQVSAKHRRPDGHHFLARPSALAFGAAGTFATIHETDEPTQGTATPADFMGPTLWTADRTRFDGGHASHLDMLHNSPLGMGIAWERDNVYWVFDGAHAAITRYDFGRDHGLGGTEHEDGEVARFVEGEVARVAEVPSHMEIDAARGVLYVADTGNNRIAVLEMTSGVRGGPFGPNYDGGRQYRMNDATLRTLVHGEDVGMALPSGLALAGGTLFVTDNALGSVFAFSEEGELLDRLDLGLPPGALMGIALDSAGRILVVDAAGHRVLRIAPFEDARGTP